jgi:predicted phosphoadenosine phosphosulfate sulfurtransferase
LRAKWIIDGSIFKVSPRLLCLTIVNPKTDWFWVTDWWLPYFRDAWKLASLADALQKAGVPKVRMRLTSL